jgi:hypothetical protein
MHLLAIGALGWLTAFTVTASNADLQARQPNGQIAFSPPYYPTREFVLPSGPADVRGSLTCGAPFAALVKDQGNWASSVARAKKQVAKLNLQQKVSLQTKNHCRKSPRMTHFALQKVTIVTGVGWQNGSCVGNIAPVPEINFPGLCLEVSRWFRTRCPYAELKGGPSITGQSTRSAHDRRQLGFPRRYYSRPDSDYLCSLARLAWPWLTGLPAVGP